MNLGYTDVCRDSVTHTSVYKKASLVYITDIIGSFLSSVSGRKLGYNMGKLCVCNAFTASVQM